MRIHKADRFRLYPTIPEQMLSATIMGCFCFVFHSLSFNGTPPTKKSKTIHLVNMFVFIKEQTPLKAVDIITLQLSLQHLTDTSRFFRKQRVKQQRILASS
ncbi:hypothetical protein [Metabacillus iocasae]|uniref:Uncharacterized protein n=1 Tax=Priestia iocasae TaxID=2291674 RepID=A0ABS2QS64_9BACI|nr:hypothetical protein [Metabacillus iocasae]MBM7702245.1 hypothetical protein [Metabacillus iocasae]